MCRRTTDPASLLGRAVSTAGFVFAMAIAMAATVIAARADEPVIRLPEYAGVGHADSIEHGDGWTWQSLPDGLIYHSYLASVKEPRMAVQWVHESKVGYLQEVALGGRIGFLRYGSQDRFRPEGWQLDVEGAALPRIDLEESMDLVAVDYRFGVPITYGRGPYQTKLGYYHVSAHLGDELMLKHPGVPRINYTRDAIVWGHSYYAADRVRLYGEAAWSFNADGGAEPWEFQFGVEYRPDRPTGFRPTPFLAINGHVFQELGFNGNMTVETGLAWCGPSGHLFRMGMQYLTGRSDQYQFFRNYEDKLGLGIWYDY